MADTAWVIEHACRRKQIFGRRLAMLRAELLRSEGHRISAYRCPFAEDHEHYHVGHPPSLRALVDIAYAIRDVHGNAPSAQPPMERAESVNA